MAGQQSEVLELLLKIAGTDDVKALKAAFDTLGDGATESAGKTDKLTEELNALANTAGKVADAVRLKAALGETTDSLAKAQSGLAALNSEFSETDKSSRSIAKQFKQAEQAVAELTKQQQKQTLELQRATLALQQGGIDTDRLADETARLEKELVSSSQAVTEQAKQLQASQEAANRVAQRYEKLKGALAGASEQLNQIGGKFAAVSAAAIAAAGALAVYQTGKFFKSAIEDAADFEARLKEVQAVSGASAAELDKMREAAKAAALQFGFGFDEATDGLGELARATGDAETAIAALPAVLGLARAGGLEVARSAEIVTTTLTQYGLAADQASRVSDVLAQAANSTTSSVEGLGNSLSYAAPLAKQLGLGLEPTVAIIGALADQGFRGERAGTALRNVFSALADPASKFSKALTEAGIKSRDFTTVIETLGNRADKGKSVLLALDAEARPAIISLAENGGKAIRGLNKDLDDAAGATDRFAKIVGQSTGAAFERAQRSYENLKIELATPLLESLAKELDSVGAALNDFVNSDEFAAIKQQLPEIFKAGSAAVKQLIADIDFAEVAKRVAEFAKNARTNFEEFASGVKSAGEAVRDFASVVSALVNAFQTFVSGAAAVVSKVLKVGAEISVAFGKLNLYRAELTGSADDIAAAAEKLEIAERFAESFGAAFEQNAADFKRNASEMGQALESIGVTSGKVEAQLSADFDAVGIAATEMATQVDAAAEQIQGAFEGTDAGLADFDKAFSASTESAVQRAGDMAEGLRIIERTTGTLAEQTAAAFNKWQIAIREGAPAEQIEKLKAAFEDLNRKLSQETAPAAEKAGDKIKKAGNEAGKASTEVKKAGDSADNLAEGLGEVEKTAERAAVQLTGLSLKAQDLYQQINKGIGTGSSLDQYQRRIEELTGRINEQGAAIDRRIAQLKQELAATDENAQALEQVRRKYDLVDDRRAQELADLERRVQQQRQEVAREAENVQRENERLDNRQRQQNSTPGTDIRVEIVVRNEQRAGALLAELTDRDLESLAARLLEKIRRLQGGSF